MDIQIRQAGEADYREIARIDGISFGVSYTEEDFEHIFGEDPPRFLVAVQDDRLVGISGDFRFTMTVPGGGVLDLPGVTWVSVLPTHRRRGVLRALLDEQLAGYAAAGEPATVLTASEGGIYRRFGFGPATQSVKISIERRLATLLNPVDSAAVEFVAAGSARAPITELHRRWSELTPGGLGRSEGWWDHLMRDRPSQRDGMSEKIYLVHPDGYLAYRSAAQWHDGHAANRCVITDYRCVTAEAHAALWQVLLGMDLFTSIESWEVPLDDPLPFLLSDPRQVRLIANKDGMWLRPIDVAAMLSARRYLVPIEAVIEVGDQRVLLEGGPDAARCQPTERAVDVRFSVPALGSAYLGGHRVRTLARAGLVQAENASLIGQLDLALSADRAPAYGTAF
ncbi:MAG: GNAT family N-acetyltransferase [Jatrophihabitans sp.]